MAIVIRAAKEEDISRILSLYSVYILETTYSFEYEVPSLTSFKERFSKVTDQFPWLICEVDGELAGYSYASATFGRIAYQWDADVTVYLDAKFHRKGIATALYSCLFEILARQGYYNLYAIITAINETSIHFHRTLGFTDIGTFHNTGFKMGRWLDVLWMEKHIRLIDGEPVPPTPYSRMDPNIVIDICKSHHL